MHQGGVFMSLFSVHGNRSPVTGTVRDVRYRRAGSCREPRQKTEDNERMVIYIDTAHGTSGWTRSRGSSREG
jgi:phosphatidylserine decarboxylase